MPAVHSCPSCDKSLKLPDGAEAKKMKCPGCQSVLLITEDGLELASKQAVQSAPAKSARKAPPPPDDEEEEEEERPAKAKKRRPVDEDDEDEDEPRSKKRRAEEDDEDEPRPKKRRADEDEEDEDEDDRPRKKKKKRKKSGGGIPAWVWIAGGGGAAALALVLVLVLFVFGGGGNVANLDKVKVGMTEKEVYDLVGKPHHVEMGMSVWSNPRVSEAEARANNPETAKRIKEALLVIFVNGKATTVEYKKGPASR
jgi:LSD1 subclass zinc finger protein